MRKAKYRSRNVEVFGVKKHGDPVLAEYAYGEGSLDSTPFTLVQLCRSEVGVSYFPLYG